MTAPLTPPECDLRGMPYMPLDVMRLRDSDLALLASPDAFRAAVLLWCAAWHQLPGGSLPNDERALARLAGVDDKTWKRCRDQALRSWAIASDGRLYHPVVAEKAIEAWAERLRFRERREKDRERLDEWRKKQDVKRVSDGVHNVGETGRKGKGKGNTPLSPPEGAGFDFLAEPAEPPRVSEVADAIWAVTPQIARNRSSTAEVRKALEVAGRLKHLDLIGTCVAAYYRSPDAAKEGGKYAKPPHAFIKSDRWKDWNPEQRAEIQVAPIVGGVPDLGFC